MNGKTLSEQEVLDGLKKLSRVIETPVPMTMVALTRLTGIPYVKMQILSDNGIITYEVIPGPWPGRKFKWVWSGPRPNIHMARKLMETVYKPRRAHMTVIPLPETSKAEMKSLVKVTKEYCITKSLDGFTAEVVVKQGNGAAAQVSAEVPTEATAEQLKCFGYAFLTAADELSK